MMTVLFLAPLLLLPWAVPQAGTTTAACAYRAALAAERPLGVPFEQLEARATAAMDGERYEEAVRLFSAGLDLDPYWVQGRWRLSLLLTDAGCHAEAKEQLQQILAVRPDGTQAWALLGVNEMRLSELDAAFAHLTRAAAAGLPDGELGKEAQRSYALLLVRRGAFAAASRQLSQLARLLTDDPEVTAACGLTALRLARLPWEVPEGERELVLATGRATQAALRGQLEQARREFERLLTRHPRVRGLHLAYGLVLAAVAPDEALAQLRREVEFHPDNAEAQLEVALQLLDRGDAAQALAPAQAAVRLTPSSYLTHLAVGRARLAAGSVAEAIAALEEAARLAPEAREIYVSLAQAYARAGRTADVERTRATMQQLDAQRGAGAR